MVSFVGFFLHFARLTNIVLISPSSHCWVFSMPLLGNMRVPVQFSVSDKLSTASESFRETWVPLTDQGQQLLATKLSENPTHFTGGYRAHDSLATARGRVASVVPLEFSRISLAQLKLPDTLRRLEWILRA